jgi:hypothetical protein
MTENPPLKQAVYPEYTQADHDAMFASVVWFREQQQSGALAKYEGMHVAFVGQTILDADRDKNALIWRVEALGTDPPMNRVCVFYVPTAEESWLW